MFNTRRVLGLALVAATTLPACNNNKGLGRKGEDAGRNAQPESGCVLMNPGGDPCALDPPDASLERVADGSLERALDASLDRAPDARAVCTWGSDQDCNDSPESSVLWGICQSNGTCMCINGSITSPKTGRCVRPEVTTCTGSYKACGCGCCGGGTPATVCYYPSAGDSLSAIKAADEAARTSPSCDMAGCSLGQRYLCCVDVPAEPVGAAQYSATASIGAYDRINLKKTGIDGTCLYLNLVSPRSLPDAIPLRVSLPAGWDLETTIAAGPCGGSAVDQSIGVQGTVTFSPKGTTCAISAHLTAFFTVAAQGEVLTKRIDADNVPIGEGLPFDTCP